MAVKVRGRPGAPPVEGNRCVDRGPDAPTKPEVDIKSALAAANGGDSAASNVDHVDNQHRTRGSSEPRTPHKQQQLPHQEQRFGKRGSGQAFALGLFQILKTEDPKVIGWSPSGKAFRIGDSDKFCKDIMPRFFKQNKYSSFQRQLNLYGFRKLVRGNEAGGYMHPLFERGKPQQLSQVRRGYFPEIPPEFAHDVHGHGLNENTSIDGTRQGMVNGNCIFGNPSVSHVQRGRILGLPASHGPLGVNGGGGGRSASVGRLERLGIAPAAAAAVAAVRDAAVPPGGTSSGRLLGLTGSENYGRDHGRMTAKVPGMDAAGCPRGPLPSLEVVTGRLSNLTAGGGVAAEMPPTLGRLVPTAINALPLTREPSPMKPNGNSQGNCHSNANGHGHVDGRRSYATPPSLSSNMPQLPATPSQRGGYHPPPYGRSQDDLNLNLTPRSPFTYAPIMGMSTEGEAGGPPSFGTEWSPKGFLHDGNFDSFGEQLSRERGGQEQRRGHGHGLEFFVSNNGNHLHRPSPYSPRVPLQQTHSRDDLDAIRPRKTRRCIEPPLIKTSDLTSNKCISRDAIVPASSHYQQQLQPFLGVDHIHSGVGGVHPPPSSTYPGSDEPPAAPRRLVQNTPSRTELRGAAKKGKVGGGDKRDIVPGRKNMISLENPDEADMDTEGGGGDMTVRPSYRLPNREVYPLVSPVTSAPKGFSVGPSWLNQRPPSRGELTPDPTPAAVRRGDSPPSTKSEDRCPGGGGPGGIGLTKEAMRRMAKMMTPNPPPTESIVLDELGDNLPLLDIGKTPQEHFPRQQLQVQGGQGRPRDLDERRNQHQSSHRRTPDPGALGGAHQASEVSGRRPTAAEAAKFLQQRSSVDEVIGLLSTPNSGSDGGFEDEGARMHSCDPAQFDSWRNSLTKVLGHLGFDFEDEQGVPLSEGKRSPDGRSSARSMSQYLSWGGTSAMSFEEQPEEFHESLKQIPMRWRSSLSSIMTSMASNGGGTLENNGAQGAGGSGGVDMGIAGDGRSGKRLEQQASLEMLQSVMRETLESMSSGQGGQDGQDHECVDGGEEEAKAAATAALAMGSMCRDKPINNLGGRNGGSDDAGSESGHRGHSAYYPQQKGGGVGGGSGGYNHDHTTF